MKANWVAQINEYVEADKYNSPTEYSILSPAMTTPRMTYINDITAMEDDVDSVEGFRVEGIKSNGTRSIGKAAV